MILAWFKRFIATIAKYGIPKEDIYNFDETGFLLGVARTAKAPDRRGRPMVAQPGNRD